MKVILLSNVFCNVFDIGISRTLFRTKKYGTSIFLFQQIVIICQTHLLLRKTSLKNTFCVMSSFLRKREKILGHFNTHSLTTFFHTSIKEFQLILITKRNKQLKKLSNRRNKFSVRWLIFSTDFSLSRLILTNTALKYYKDCEWIQKNLTFTEARSLVSTPMSNVSWQIISVEKI